MGLDSFSSDNQETEDNEEETTSEPEASGLDSFRTTTSRGGSSEDNESGDEDEQIFGLPPRKWVAMDVDDRVRHVRENHVEDYYPSHQPDARWSFARAVMIQCVCKNTFTIKDKGECSKCGRVYKDAGRTVIKVEETEDVVNNGK